MRTVHSDLIRMLSVRLIALPFNIVVVLTQRDMVEVVECDGLERIFTNFFNLRVFEYI